jgi:hypothetical protein
MVECACKMDDWSMAADLLHYREYDEETRKSMQRSTGSSWMPLLLSKIMPCVSKGLRHRGVLKVLLTSKGWVPSPPVPSGAHASQMTKMMKTALDSIAEDVNSEEEVMKWPSGLVMGDD